LHPAIIDYLVCHDLVVYAYDVSFLSDRLIEDMYSAGFIRKASSLQKTHWWLSRKPYRVGPAIPLLVARRRPARAKGSLADHLLAVKGKIASPFVEEGIRQRFGAMSPTLNLFHSPDDKASSSRESLLFFDPKEVRTLIKRGGQTPRRIISEIADHLSPVDASHMAPAEAFVRLSLSCVAKLMNALRRADYDLSEITALRNALRRMQSELRSQQNKQGGRAFFKIKRQALMPRFRGLNKILGASEARTLTASLNCLMPLADALYRTWLAPGCGIETGAHFYQLAREAGLWLTEWEIVLLDNFFYFECFDAD
jgi:hypothetical protein